MTDTYQAFLAGKAQAADMAGFKPLWLPDFLFDFQKALAEWAILRGRAAIFADCGLGKTPMQLVWAENVRRKTGKPVLILTPLAVAPQTVREAQKFGIDCWLSRDGTVMPGLTVTNYDQLHKFTASEFAGVVCDESSGLKHFDAQRTASVIDFMRETPYRLLCTATAAPNDYIELGTSAEALGQMGFRDMLTKFFKQSVGGGDNGLAWGRAKYRLRGHAEHDFWRWVCSWARAARKPSDLGFDDARFVLPPLTINEHVISATTKREGALFDLPAVTLPEQREERRRTITDRCGVAARLINAHDKPAIAWCHLNDEAAELMRLIPGAVEVAGKDSDEAKEESFEAFCAGKVRVIVTKPVIAGWGLNFQHCAHQTFFPSHSFEQFYQAVRRSWRFGQASPVTIDMIDSEGERGVVKNLQRKSDAADAMFTKLVALMNDHLIIKRENRFAAMAQPPAWLAPQGGKAA